MNLTSKIAQFISDTKFSDLPKTTIRNAKFAFLDWLGAALAGSKHKSSDLMFKTMMKFGGSKQATILGFSEKTDIFTTALLNGYASHVLDYDDLHVKMLGHPSVPVFPAILALSEWRKKNGKEFILAYSLGVDLECRLGEAVNPEHYDHGWHSTSTLGHFGSAIGSAKLLELDVEKIIYTIGIAGTLASGVRQVFGTMCKPLHPGKAAMNGLWSAILAESGLTSSKEMIGGEKGFTSVLCEKFDPSLISYQLGEKWKVDEIVFKRHASCYRTQAVIECILSLRNRLPKEIEEVKAIHCWVPPIALNHAGFIIPKNGLEAKFSQSYCAAVAFIEGKAMEEQFTDEKTAKPTIQKAMEKVAINVDDKLNPAEAAVKIILNNGMVYSEQIDIEKDQPSQEIMLEYLKEKFLTLSSKSVTFKKSGILLDAVLNLEDIKDFAKLTALCS